MKTVTHCNSLWITMTNYSRIICQSKKCLKCLKNKALPLTKHFDIDLSSLGSAYVPDREDVLSCVISVTELDDGHGLGGGVLQVVLLTQL